MFVFVQLNCIARIQDRAPEIEVQGQQPPPEPAAVRGGGKMRFAFFRIFRIFFRIFWAGPLV